MKYKGRYVALVEYDFVIDTSTPNILPIEQIQERFRDGSFEKDLADLLRDEVFDPGFGHSKVTQTFCDIYKLPEKPNGGAEDGST